MKNYWFEVTKNDQAAVVYRSEKVAARRPIWDKKEFVLLVDKFSDKFRMNFYSSADLALPEDTRYELEVDRVLVDQIRIPNVLCDFDGMTEHLIKKKRLALKTKSHILGCESHYTFSVVWSERGHNQRQVKMYRS